jgi:hypothetical protein
MVLQKISIRLQGDGITTQKITIWIAQDILSAKLPNVIQPDLQRKIQYRKNLKNPSQMLLKSYPGMN